MSEIIINKKNYFYSLNLISTKTTSKNKVISTQKYNAYRHDILKITSLLKELGIKTTVVKNLKESLKFEDYFKKFLIFTDNNIHTYSHTFHVVINEIKKIFQVPQNTSVHLKTDTKIDINYISKNQLKEPIIGPYMEILNFLKIMMPIKSIYKLSCEFHLQKREFRLSKDRVKKICEQLFLPLQMHHSCNLETHFKIVNFNELFVRVSIASCSYIINNLSFNNINLKQILDLMRKINSTSSLKINQAFKYLIGYKTYKNETKTTLSTQLERKI